MPKETYTKTLNKLIFILKEYITKGLASLLYRSTQIERLKLNFFIQNSKEK
jgi:hypothetical protein